MRDIIEISEDSAEARYLKMLHDGRLRCSCGKLFRAQDAQPASANPYAMPICPDCSAEQQENNEDCDHYLDDLKEWFEGCKRL